MIFNLFYVYSTYVPTICMYVCVCVWPKYSIMLNYMRVSIFQYMYLDNVKFHVTYIHTYLSFVYKYVFSVDLYVTLLD